MAAEISSTKKNMEVALLGNPNSGKTTIFNALTGLRQTTANYPGVTVEKKIGYLPLDHSKDSALVLDLPGTYSLLPRSMDEDIVHHVLLGIQQGTPAPDLVVIILDAGNLERNLYLAFQVIEMGLPSILVLNMWDNAEENGLHIDLDLLSKRLGIPCIKTVGNKKRGIPELKALINNELSRLPHQSVKPVMRLSLPEEVELEVSKISTLIRSYIPGREAAVHGEALRLLSDTRNKGPLFKKEALRAPLQAMLQQARLNFEEKGIDWRALEADQRYKAIENVLRDVCLYQERQKASFSERLDRLMTHRIWGLVIFFCVMGIIFQSIFSWAQLPMDLLTTSVDWFGKVIASILPDGQLESLIVDGVLAGVGNVLIFLPQIFLLFFFIAFFEDFGYMARAAFVLDRIMKKVGLNGKAFLPLLSSFACAIPGIMATRTIPERNDRMATILVAPLMSCSARLPVYTLMIAAFIPSRKIAGLFDLKGLTLLSMYILSVLMGLGMATLFRRTLFRGDSTPFVFELPPYRIPNMKTVFMAMWERGKEFLYRAGSIIFCISIVLWFLVSYPRHEQTLMQYEQARQSVQEQLEGSALEMKLASLDQNQAGDLLRYSYAGKLGAFIEPVIRPLGFDWKIGVGLVASFAAREVLVSTLAIVYNVGKEADETSVDLVQALREERDPETGLPQYTPLVAVSLMVFFVLACQCMSTVAIVKRETNGWRWPIFMIAYMSVLAWMGSFLVYQGGKLLGYS
ncbi:MAG: ferrous iron transport protein B [Chlamydiota bacterium]|nr:ferrous iron transport protein B [Chlamydiota bacterium]